MTVSIPDFPLPFEIPHMIHPFFVHFAIALPVILLILELINSVAKRRLLSGINFFFMLLIVAVFAATYLTGEADAKDINLEALEAHKQLGVYLVYGSVVVLFFKLVSMVVDKIQIKVFFYLALIAFIATSFIEGKRGGELVYKYGVNVKAASNVAAKTNASDKKANEPKKESKEHTAIKADESKENKETNSSKPKSAKEVNTTVSEPKESNMTQNEEKSQESEHNKKTQEVNETKAEPMKEHTEAVEVNKTEEKSEAMPESAELKEHNETEANVTH